MVAERSSHTNRISSRRLQGGTWHGLLFLTMAFSREVEGEMDRALAIVPLSARGFAALYEMARGPALTQRALAARLGLSSSTVSELLRRLSRRGLVSRMVVTEAGLAALAHAERVATRLENDWSRRLDAAAANPFAGLRRYGLRRWLAESRAALACEHPLPDRRVG